MNETIAKQIVQGFAGALKGLKLYPIQHPALTRQIQTLLAALNDFSRGQAALKIGVLEGALIVDDVLFAHDLQAADDLAAVIEALGISGLLINPGIGDQELRGFLQVLHSGEGKDGKLEGLFAARDIASIKILKTEEDEELPRSPRETYGKAITVMENIFHDVRLGKIPSSVEAMKVVKAMAKLTIAEPHALFALSMLKDYDNYTFTHSVNVSVIALAVGRACGLSEEQLRILGLGGLLHDLGKLKIDIGIITKPGRLTEAEFEEIKKHPGTGADLAEQMEGVTTEVVDIVIGHHLRFDRTGYPADARGRIISSLADMAAIADTYDALTTLRSYQRPTTPRKAVERLRELTGTVLHSQFTERFITSLGTYPVGTLVRLDDNAIGLVVRVGSQDPDAVDIKLLFSPDGNRLEQPLPISLSGEAAKRIVGEVDPFTKGIEVTDYFG